MNWYLVELKEAAEYGYTKKLLSRFYSHAISFIHQLVMQLTLYNNNIKRMTELLLRKNKTTYVSGMYR